MLPQPVITPSSFMTERSASAPWPPQSPLPCLRTRAGQQCSAARCLAGWQGPLFLTEAKKKHQQQTKPKEQNLHGTSGRFPCTWAFSRGGCRGAAVSICAHGAPAGARCGPGTWRGCRMGDALQTLFLFAKILCRAGEQGRDLLQGSAHPSFTFPALSLPAAGAAKKNRIRPQAGAPLEPPRVRPRSHGSHGFGVCLLCFAGLTWLHLQNAVMSEHPLSDQKGPVEV